MYDAQNMDSNKKVSTAVDTSGDWLDDINKMYAVLQMSGSLLKDMTYEDSWAYIRARGLNSLSRCSNLTLMLDDIVKWGERLKSCNDVDDSE